MEKNHGNDNKLSVFLAELIGTTVLSLGLNLSWTASNIVAQWNPLTKTLLYSSNVYFLYVMAGVCLYSVFYLFSPISGGHFNPAVTIAVYISLAFNAHNLVIGCMIILAQFLGAFSGMLLSRGFRVLTNGVNQATQYPEAVWFGSVSNLAYP